jgi:hypothetical protein
MSKFQFVFLDPLLGGKLLLLCQLADDISTRGEIIL